MRLPSLGLGCLLLCLGPAVTASSAPADEAETTAIAAICTASAYTPSQGERTVSIQPGMGDGGFKVDANPEAQKWFDYGIKLYHAFYHQDAKLAFARAVKADPDCAMCVWGQALADGPTQNYDIPYAQIMEALALAKKAEGLAGSASQRDRDLIQALIIRYAPATALKPDILATIITSAAPFEDLKAAYAYAEAMEKIAKANPDSDDLAALAAHAWLTVRQHEGAEIGGRAMAILEPALKRNPDSSAATHFYIHATEFAGKPALALPYAKKLAGEAPNASHLVHMAAHTFFRVGLYEDAALVNADALGIAATYNKAENAPDPLVKSDYYAHNYNFGLGGAMMSGDAALALKFAEHAPYAWPDASDPSRMKAAIAYGLYDPKDALAIHDPKAAHGENSYHYARGEAFARLGDVRGLAAEINAIPDGSWLHKATNPADLLPRRVLEGRAAMLAGQPEKAAAAYAEAAAIQDRFYRGAMDPPPWWYPIDRSVAAAWLKAGKYEAAAKAAQTSLAAWPADALALTVLARTEDKLGEAVDAKRHRAEALKAWRGGDLDKISNDLI